MDNAVSLVQAFLRLSGYLTVTEFPVLAWSQHGHKQRRPQALTDLDVLAYRFAADPSPASRNDYVWERDPDADRLLGAQPGQPDMIIGEVKEGRAELNYSADNAQVFRAALRQFGCSRNGGGGHAGHGAEEMADSLLRHGRARTPYGHDVRLIVFAAKPPKPEPGQPLPHYHVVLLGDIVRLMHRFITRHWDAVRASDSKDPGFGFVLMLEKALRGRGDRVTLTPP